MYFGLTHHKFSFIVTPDEFQTVFRRDDYSFIYTNQRAGLDYAFTPQETVFTAYSQYWERVISAREALSHQALWAITQEFYVSLTDSLKKVVFQEFSSKNNGEIDFKHVWTREPTVELAPTSITYSAEENKLFTKYSNNDGMMAMQLSYPKTIARDGKAGSLSTGHYPMFFIYQDLIRHIKTLSKKAKVLHIGGTLFKPNLWISTAALPYINENHYLQKNCLKFQA